MLKGKRSVIWKTPKNQVVKWASLSSSKRELLSYFGVNDKGRNFKTLKERLDYDNIDISSIEQRRKIKLRSFPNIIPLSEYLIENSKSSRKNIKRRLISEGYLKNECEICKNNGTWMNKPISLHIDHKNGISNDNRIENLRLLCPNCHSQTETFAGKNNKKETRKCLCGSKIHRQNKSGICVKCYRKLPREQNRKVIRPSKIELEKIVWEKSIVKIAKVFNVSDNTIRKWCKSYSIKTPKMGYWNQKQVNIG